MSDAKKHDLNLFKSWNFGKTNYLIFGIGIIVILIGYLIMLAGGTSSYLSLRLAPMVLVLGYCVVIPVAILYKPKQ